MSGIRSIFCYSIIPRLTRWDTEVQPDPNSIPDWAITQLGELAEQQPFGSGRVTIGLGFDTLNLPRSQVQDLYQNARKHGVKLITSHCNSNIPSQ